MDISYIEDLFDLFIDSVGRCSELFNLVALSSEIDQDEHEEITQDELVSVASVFISSSFDGYIKQLKLDLAKAKEYKDIIEEQFVKICTAEKENKEAAFNKIAVSLHNNYKGSVDAFTKLIIQSGEAANIMLSLECISKDPARVLDYQEKLNKRRNEYEGMLVIYDVILHGMNSMMHTYNRYVTDPHILEEVNVVYGTGD